MQNRFQKFLTAPVFPEDQDKTRTAYYLNIFVFISLGVVVLSFLIRLAQGAALFASFSLLLLGLLVGLVTAWRLMRNGRVRRAAYLYIAMIWLTSTLLAFSGSGVKGTGFTSYFVVMLLTGFLLGARSAVEVAVISIISAFGLSYAESTGKYVPASPYGVTTEATMLFISSALFMVVTITSLRNEIETSVTSARNTSQDNAELIQLRDALELRVQERTVTLEKRANQLQIVSSVARTIASMQDLDTLLNNTTQLVSTEFGFYHAGIFLLDAARENAVLQAANSEGGQRMLNRQHKLPLDNNSIVGFATSRGEPRIALDVGEDAVYFNNPDLSETRSEMAIPLRIGGNVIGALDVQSTETNAFSQEDISVLVTLADQIAIAIENTRLLNETKSALAEAQAAFEKYVQQEWSNFTQQARHNGFIYDGKQVLPMDERARIERAKTIQTGRLSLKKQSPTISIPIKLRGQTIGVLDVHSKKDNRHWTDDEISLLEAAAERAAIALENARLIESAQRRAARERSIGEISAKIGNASDFNAILRATVEEMGRRIGATEVIFEIDSVNGNGNGEK